VEMGWKMGWKMGRGKSNNVLNNRLRFACHFPPQTLFFSPVAAAFCFDSLHTLGRHSNAF